MFPIARKRVTYWRTRWHKAKRGTKERSRAYRMLVLRKHQLQRLIRRHPKPTVEHVSRRGLVIIAEFEGFRSKPYRDAVGVWTIGYGETRGIGPHTAPWSQAFAWRRLRERVDRDYLRPVLAYCASVGYKPSQNEADALASLAYNVGPAIFSSRSTIGQAIRSHDRRNIADAFLVYRYAGGRVLAGLERRRRAERALFLAR